MLSAATEDASEVFTARLITAWSKREPGKWFPEKITKKEGKEMSAFVVNKSHINAILHAGMTVRYPPMRWYHEGQDYILNDETANQVGQMLLDECVHSVSYRYGEDGIASLPGPCNAEWLIPFEYHFTDKRPSPLQALKLISCYEYQSCEHPEWKTSQAKAFCQALRNSTITRLPGYDEASWEWDDPEYYKINDAVRR